MRKGTSAPRYISLQATPLTPILSALKRNDHVVLKGLGLCFFDYLALLSEGRGGEFVREDCKLVYKISGREPKIYCFSRRGLPLHARAVNQKNVEDIHRPLASTMEKFREFRRMAGIGHPPNFQTHVWPLIALEVEIVYYQHLLRARDVPHDSFERSYITANENERADLLTYYKIDQRDRWDWHTIKKPYRAHPDETNTLGAWQRWLNEYLHEDVRQAQLGNAHGPHAAARSVLRDIRNQLRSVIDHQGVKDRQVPGESRWYLRDKFSPLNTYLSVGPPVERIEQMIALIEVGILQVLEPNAKIEETENGWRVGNIRLNAIIEARMPAPSLKKTTDPLLMQLHKSGQCRLYHNGSYETEALDTNTKPYQVVFGAERTPNERLFALGVPTEGVRWVTTTVPRPFANSVLLRSTDAVARAALRQAQKDLSDNNVPLGG